MSSACCASFPPPRQSSHPVDVGLRSEAAIIQALVQRGYAVLVPWGTNQRYDLVVDLGDKFARIQCKTGRLRNGAVHFNTMSTRANTRGAYRRPYDGEIEYFAVYCPPTINNQRCGVRWARDYALPGGGSGVATDLHLPDPPA